VTATGGVLDRHDRLWPAVLVSGAVHLALVALALFGRPGPRLDLDQKPIVARLVRLGEPRPKEYLPRKEAPPPAPEAPPAEVPSAPPAPVAAAPAPAAPTKAPGPATAKAPPAAPPATTRDRLAGILKDVRRDIQAGDPSGDPMGDSAEGEGDQYQALVKRALDAEYRLPSTISERERLFLAGEVLLFIEPDGRLARYVVEKRSGNSAFDEALERAVRQARLPPPPTAQRELYRRTGLLVIFKASPPGGP
jgi:colicin import membrane protein/protein TonB